MGKDSAAGPHRPQRWAMPSKKEAGFLFNPLAYRHPIVLSDFQNQSDPVHGGAETQALTWQYHKPGPFPISTKGRKWGRGAFVPVDPGLFRGSHGNRGRFRNLVGDFRADNRGLDGPGRSHKSYLAGPCQQMCVSGLPPGSFPTEHPRGQPFDQSFPPPARGGALGQLWSRPKGPTGPRDQAATLGRGQPVSIYEQTDLSGALSTQDRAANFRAAKLSSAPS